MDYKTPRAALDSASPTKMSTRALLLVGIAAAAGLAVLAVSGKSSATTAKRGVGGLVATTTITTQGGQGTWEYDGTQWVLVGV